MRLTLKTKVVLLALIPIVLFALVISGAAVKILQNLAEKEVAETRERLMQESRTLLENYSQIAGVCQRSCRVDHSFTQLPSALLQASQGSVLHPR